MIGLIQHGRLTCVIASAFLLLIPIKGQTGMIQHLDASVEASIITDGTSRVTSWKDQTTYSNDAIPNTGSVYKVQENELTWLDFGEGRNVLELFSGEGSDTWLDQSPGTGGFCVILSFKAGSLHDNWNDLIGNSSATASGYGMRYSSSGSIRVYLGGQIITGPGVDIGKPIIMALNYDAASGSYMFWDSKSKNTISGIIASADFSLSDAVKLGSTNNTGRFFKGYVGEVKIFSTNLSDEQFIDEQNSFFLKWVAADSEKEPPVPDPASFQIAPAGVSGSIITMTATLGSDANGPVEYLFTEISGNSGGSPGNWQTNPNYRDGDLDPQTYYAYTVTMRDAYGNTGEPSDTFSAITTAYLQPGLENELEYGAYYGYQGWHFAQGDGRINADDWVHWFEGGIPDAVHIHGDMWPDLREYDQDKLYETQMIYPNGETAGLYSCYDYSTIDLHVKWMKEYGIKGCAVQRFTSSIDKANKLEQGDKKLRDFMTACEKYGVKFWIMHDSGKGDDKEYERITNDWKHLVEDLDVLQSPAYTWQNGLPVYGLWGLGVSTRGWTPEQAADLIDFYHNGEEKYRTYICGGVPVIWRTNPPEGWKTVFDSLDMISPWRTIFNNPDKFKSRMQADLDYCNQMGIDYNPVVSPGASTKHLRDSDAMRNWKPRNGGHFLWKQAYEVCKMNSKFMYVAMFDEVDEGTAMYKLVETPDNLPVGADQVPLNEDGYKLPSDWYLQVGTEIQKMIEGSTALTPTLPLTPEMTGVNDSKSIGALRVYPVPARNKLFVSGFIKPGIFKLINVNGIIVSEGQLNDNTVDVANLATGIYVFRMNSMALRFLKE